jgi:hypothetical protein
VRLSKCSQRDNRFGIEFYGAPVAKSDRRITSTARQTPHADDAFFNEMGMRFGIEFVVSNGPRQRALEQFGRGSFADIASVQLFAVNGRAAHACDRASSQRIRSGHAPCSCRHFARLRGALHIVSFVYAHRDDALASRRAIYDSRLEIGSNLLTAHLHRLVVFVTNARPHRAVSGHGNAVWAAERDSHTVSANHSPTISFNIG